MNRWTGSALALVMLATASGTSPVAAQANRAQSISASDRQQGAQAHPQLLEQFGGGYEGRQAAYVTQVGRRIAVQSGLANSSSEFTITLLNSPVNNAFAIPGGYVYVTRQLMALMNDEAELASVLGHEVGHVAARHSSSRNRTSTIGAVLTGLLGVVTGNSQIAQIAGQAAQLYTLRFSRTQEYQADDLGIRYLAGAGYDPRAASTMLASLAAQTTLDARLAGRDARTAPEWGSTHPDPASRVARARQRADATRATAAARNRDAFLSAIDGMLYGDDPRQGIVDGNSFRHPDLRVMFTVPSGYTMTNGTRAVSVTGQGGQAQFSNAAYNGNLPVYVGNVFRDLAGDSGSIPTNSVRSTRVNGLPVAYATGRASTRSGQVDVTVYAYQFGPSTAYHFVMVTPAGRGIGPFQSMVQSVNRMTEQQAAAIQPRRVDVVTVGRGDTPASLAARMAYTDYKLERFLTLNALPANARLTPGQKVKLIVYER
jgi:predicted Zn-dependent protease